MNNRIKGQHDRAKKWKYYMAYNFPATRVGVGKSHFSIFKMHSKDSCYLLTEKKKIAVSLINSEIIFKKTRTTDNRWLNRNSVMHIKIN